MINQAIELKAEGLLRDSNTFSYPIKVEECAKYLKLPISELDIEDEISGFLAIKDKESIIGVNMKHHINRKRFTIAHELGHFILHKNENPLFIDKNESNVIAIYNRDEKSSRGEILKEKEANSFAAALLMPKKLIKEAIENSINKNNILSLIDELARKFEVSQHAMSIRLSDLGYSDYTNAF
ncbi:hypothetical protein GCM10011514_00940 [Emticicia aquatilis]|uniref:IrrE N-terminal-like domain-containing protein n=1 Tax=Emticicia aquatilis TaxID=1537369 RepID=A0A916YCZ6_9BACT|nr:ImmA/IrrE family metallo-endopeptidase [Emticicia aquatilis]GGD40678.1 hypothetical protein GCM10011514_00940 [Emticicia aquatilis]